MDDDNGLELSLGLSLGGSAGKSKARDASLVEPKSEPQVEESSSKGGSQTPDAHSPVAPAFGNFWVQPGGSSTPMVDGSIEPARHQSQIPRYQDVRTSNNGGNDSEQMPVTSNHKLLSEEVNFQKKHHTAADQLDAFSKSSDGGAKNAPISISTDDGSTGENEDVAESEAEGSNSWLVAQREDSAKGSAVNKGSNRKRPPDDAAVGFQGKRQPSFSGSESSSGKLPPGNPMSVQASNVPVMPHQAPAQVSGPPTITDAQNFHPVHAVQLSPPTNGGLAVQTTSGASQIAFGYQAVQLPTLETGSTWAFGVPHVLSSYTARDKAEPTGTKQADDGKKGQEAGASSTAQAEDEKKTDRAFPLMSSAIRPGIAPNVRFGGSGSYPDLPWVSITDPGPNGRTISGVTYKFGRNEVKIVCACHGTHMYPEEFIQHARADAPDLPVGNQAAEN